METPKFITYANLTWPEVAALPRDIPMIIPLGHGYKLDVLTQSLGHPAAICLLPEIPYGWVGSGLSVPEYLLSQAVNNLIISLRDDGFTQVYIVCPQSVNLMLKIFQINIPIQKVVIEPETLIDDNDRHKVVIIPFGHTEQHAYHLPLATDTLIIESISKKTTQLSSNLAVTLPCFPYGVSTHRKAFAGTLSIGGRAMEDFCIGIIDNLVNRSFSRFYFMNGHGGNHSFLVNAVKYIGEKYPWVFCATSWLYLSGTTGIRALEKYRHSEIGGMGHACELETSLMLYLYPELTKMHLVVDETNFIKTSSFYMDWVEGGSLIANPPWEDDTKTGAYGAGSLACIENGKLWFEVAVKEKQEHIKEIHEQYQRRLLLRQSRSPH